MEKLALWFWAFLDSERFVPEGLALKALWPRFRGAWQSFRASRGLVGVVFLAALSFKIIGIVLRSQAHSFWLERSIAVLELEGEEPKRASWAVAG